MKKIFLMAVVLLVLADGASTAQEQYRPFLFQINADVNFPDNNVLFQFGGGGSVSGQYVFPFFKSLSAGMSVDYQYIKLKNTDIADTGSLSLISTQAVTRAGIVLFNLIELYVSGGIGYFYTFMNANPDSWGSNMAWNAEAGTGIRISPSLTILINGSYKGYPGLCNVFTVGSGVSLRIGGKK